MKVRSQPVQSIPALNQGQEVSPRCAPKLYGDTLEYRNQAAKQDNCFIRAMKCVVEVVKNFFEFVCCCRKPAIRLTPEERQREDIQMDVQVEDHFARRVFSRYDYLRAQVGNARFDALPEMPLTQSLRNRIEQATGYIDFLKESDLQHPVMRGTDQYNRPFVAVKVRDTSNGLIAHPVYVKCFHQRYEGQSQPWVQAGRHPSILRPNPGLDDSHMSPTQFRELAQIIRGEHPRYTLVNN